jgi:hypothetical protein
MKRHSVTELTPRPVRPSVERPDRVAMPPEERPTAPQTERAPAERAPPRPTERTSEMPWSGVERKSARRVRHTIALGDALAEVERSFKIPKDAEQRILKVVLARVAAGRAARANRGVDGAAAEGAPAGGPTAPREPESGIKKVTLAGVLAAHAEPTERQTPVAAECVSSEHLSYRRTRVPSRVVLVTVSILSLCILVACLVLRRVW